MSRGFDSVPAGRNDNANLEDLFELFDFRSATKGYVAIRLLPYSMLPIKRHWIHALNKEKKPTAFPKMCVEFNPDDTNKPLKGRVCPYCKLEHGPMRENYPAHYEEFMLANAIIRPLQDSTRINRKKFTPAEKKTGIKDVTSESATPVRIVRLPMGVARRIKEMAELNGNKHVNDAKKGIDVLIKYDPKAKNAGDTYRLERGDRTPLTAEELEYLRYDLEPFEEIYDALGRTDSAAAMADLKKSTLIGGGSRDEDDDEDEDGDDDGFSRGGKKGKKDKKKSSRDDDDDEDDDEDDDDDDDDDRASKKGKKGKKDKSKKRFADDDEDDDEDDEDEDEDEDDDRSSKKKSSKKSGKSSKKSSKRFADDDDDDDDDDDEDDDEDDDDRSSKKKSSKKSGTKKSSKVAGKKKKASKDDDDEDDDDEDDDEDDRPSKKKPSKKTSVKKSGTKKKKASKDDDEDEDEDEDDDRSSKKKSSKKSGKSKR